ncbi:TPA: NrdH-redoxin, partial [Corynebacterium striatum]|nr:NrdH-redoxin [Corynebacterium striatum]HAT1138289.1 NrdH-redoxin [Corynebacterium striatum]HAT1158846.1 NrdH-redoxin [Corynebacterium striatum]HAT1161561.1 NrdH-redoxin [Corynebacterium striatum]HAT1164307.1 NrdH-redoxin [Corynebacterium striatum]
AKEHTGYLATLGHASAPVIVDEAGNSFSGFRPDKLRQAA